jgi:hypothetical protein
MTAYVVTLYRKDGTEYKLTVRADQLSDLLVEFVGNADYQSIAIHKRNV